MQPPVPGGVVDAALLQRVRAWCCAGALPRMTLPLAVACIEPHEGLDAVACDIDGSHRLARLGRLRGLAWRAQVLLRDLGPAHDLQPGDPWDCGWWRAGALAAAQPFRPRRPTLLMVRDTPTDDARDMTAGLLAALEANAGAYLRPLRVLLVTTRPHARCAPL